MVEFAGRRRACRRLADGRAACCPPTRDPAMFVVRDADTTVYIFGTFHALDGQSEWFNDQVKRRLRQSNELVLETLIPEAPGTDRAAAPAAGRRTRHRLRLLPRDHAHGDQRRQLAGHAGRQWRRHGASPRGRS